VHATHLAAGDIQVLGGARVTAADIDSVWVDGAPVVSGGVSP
jgi:hypothetical protein